MRLGRWSQMAMAAAVACATIARADDDRLPVSVQVVVLKKILQFDRELETREVKVLVLSADDAEAEKVTAAFQAVSIEARAVKPAALAGALSGASVLYALPGAMTAGVKDACVKSGVLTVGTAAEVKAGEVSVAIGKKADGKPEIFIHLKSAKGEKHSFASSLLGLATVVQ